MSTLFLLPFVVFAQPDMVVRDGPAPGEERSGSAFVETVELDNAGPVATLGDALDGAPGVQVLRSGDVGRAEFLTLRGTTAQQVAVFLDDIPLSGGRGGAFDLSTLPAGWINRADVARGPSAAMYGSGAQGGVLILRTGGADGLRARSRYGSGGLLQLDMSAGQSGQADGLVVGSFSTAQGNTGFVDSRGDARTRENAGHTRVGGLATTRVPLAGGHLSMLAEGLWLGRGEPGPEQFPNRRAESEQTRAQFGLSWRTDTLQAMGFARLQTLDFADPEPIFADDPSDFSLQDRALGGRLGAGHDWVGGRFELAADLRHDAARTVDETTRENARFASGASAQNVWLPWAPLRLSAGIRLDDTDRRDSIWAPQAGVVWAMGDFELRANAGRSFRDPSLDELYLRAPGLSGDPDLRPEDGWGGDLGVTWQSGRHRLQAVGFAQRFERMILFVPIDAYRVRAQDDFEAEIFGVELLAEGGVGRYFGSASYTLTDAQDPRSGNPLPHRARHLLRLQAQARIGRAVMSTAVGFRGEVAADRFGARKLPAYALWQIGARGPLGAGFFAGLQFRNLLDVRALDAAQQPRPGRTFLGTVSFAH